MAYEELEGNGISNLYVEQKTFPFSFFLPSPFSDSIAQKAPHLAGVDDVSCR